MAVSFFRISFVAIFLSFFYLSQSFADQSYLSGMFGMVAQSKGTEAITAMSSYKTDVDTCLAEHAAGDCTSLSPFAGTTYFTYAFSSDSFKQSNDYTIIATPTAAADAQSGSLISYVCSNGACACHGTGTYASSC